MIKLKKKPNLIGNEEVSGSSPPNSLSKIKGYSDYKVVVALFIQ